MKVVFEVVTLSEAFAGVWERLAGSVGAEVRLRAGAAGDAGEGVGACGVIIAAGGEESAALEVLRSGRAEAGPQVAVVGAEASHRQVVAMLKRGADDVFLLPGDLSALRAWMEERVEARASIRNAETLAADQRESYDFSRLIGRSAGLRMALERAARVIPRGAASVLITGETGTGKELMARAIHFNGPRRGGPFVEINCAAIPDHLLEAELFGYERGAFTDAKVPKPGLFEAANGGTLFLDEIGDLSLELQGKLLRVLESKRVRRLGSLRDQEIDARIVAATHVDLASTARQGRFRSDLYYRLSVVPIHLPALRDRGDDVLLLAEHFLDELSAEYEVARPELTREVRRALLGYLWPGNVRELKNAVERAVLLGAGDLRVEDLFVESLAAPERGAGLIPFPASMEQIQAAVARETVEVCGGNKSEAAKVLGVSRRHLYVLLRRGEETAGERMAPEEAAPRAPHYPQPLVEGVPDGHG